MKIKLRKTELLHLIHKEYGVLISKDNVDMILSDEDELSIWLKHGVQNVSKVMELVSKTDKEDNRHH